MNELTFSEIQAAFLDGGSGKCGGGSAISQSFSVTVTEKMMAHFRELSGDLNPMHTDAEYARQNGFPGCLVYGLLTTSFYSALAGMYLPGKYCLLQEVSAQFANPVFVGDALTVSGKVAEVQETFRRIVIKARIVNQYGKTVNRATITAGVLK